jgi:hypothetical protein
MFFSSAAGIGSARKFRATVISVVLGLSMSGCGGRKLIESDPIDPHRAQL